MHFECSELDKTASAEAYFFKCGHKGWWGSI